MSLHRASTAFAYPKQIGNTASTLRNGRDTSLHYHVPTNSFNPSQKGEGHGHHPGNDTWYAQHLPESHARQVNGYGSRAQAASRSKDGCDECVSRNGVWRERGRCLDPHAFLLSRSPPAVGETAWLGGAQLRLSRPCTASRCCMVLPPTAACLQRSDEVNEAAVRRRHAPCRPSADSGARRPPYDHLALGHRHLLPPLLRPHGRRISTRSLT